MDFNIITVHYHPFFFLQESLANNYKIFKKEKIKFNHYLLDNNYPLEKDNQKKIKHLCECYEITYLNSGKNLGLVQGKNYFHEKIKPKDIIFHLESDVHLLTENTLTSVYEIEKNNDIQNVIYLNNKNLNDYNKNIFKINDINMYELDINDVNYTWIQCCFYNTNYQLKIQKILDNDKRNNYDFPGENNEFFKQEKIPFLVTNDIYEDMEYYRFKNYFEYEYYKAFVYYWSKFEKQYELLTFEDFIDNYDYFFEMEERFHGCYDNFKIRAKNYVIKPNFYFEKTKIKFNKINTNQIIKNRIKKDRCENMHKINYDNILAKIKDIKYEA
jgi:hypothetical protein